MTETKQYRIESIPESPFGMGRHVKHDPASRRYPFMTTYPYRGVATALEPIYHERHVPIFDQGDIGSCTGNAALGILATGPYWSALPESVQAYGLIAPTGRVPWNEDGAKFLYSSITAADDFPGDYPPDDTGSDGLSAAKVLTRWQAVPGYQHTFSADQALSALQSFPLLVGTVWTDRMFEPDSRGRITYSAKDQVDGGHEWIVDEYVPAGQLPSGALYPVSSKTAAIGGTTSWGTGFGRSGRFYLTVDQFGQLLAQDGDVIVLSAPQSAPPTPVPDHPADPDAVLAAAMHEWLTAKGL